MSMEDLDQYLPGIVSGDARQFAGWMARCEGRLRDSLSPFAASVDAEAVLQEALLRVWQVAPRFVPDGRPNGLLRLGVRIARNLAVDELRRRQREVRDLDVQDGDATGPVEEMAEVPVVPDPLLRRLIADCREQLPGKPAQALAARLEGAGATPDETLAERLGMRLNTFLQNVGRARRLLAECLERRGVPLLQELG